MNLAALVAQLVRHEGKRATAYMDTVGTITVGVGRNLSDKGLSEDEITYLLNNDIDEVLEDCATFPWFAGLDDVRQRVIADMRFNLGPSRIRAFGRMLRAVEQGEYRRAATAMRDSRWYRQVKGRGERLALMMQHGKDLE